MIRIFLSAFVVLLIPSAHSNVDQHIKSRPYCQIELGKDLCVRLNVHGTISRKQAARFDLKFFTKDGKKIDKFDQKPEVLLWMIMRNGHEHGSDPVKVTAMKSGYQVSEAKFLMLGQWQIKLKLKYQGKTVSGFIPFCVRQDVSKSAVSRC